MQGLLSFIRVVSFIGELLCDHISRSLFQAPCKYQSISRCSNVGMGSVKMKSSSYKSLLTRGKNLVKLSNSQVISFGVISSRTLSHPAPTCFQLGVRESGHTLFHDSPSSSHILHFFFSKSAVSLTEANRALLFSPNGSRIGGGVHRYVFFLPAQKINGSTEVQTHSTCTLRVNTTNHSHAAHNYTFSA